MVCYFEDGSFCTQHDTIYSIDVIASVQDIAELNKQGADLSLGRVLMIGQRKFDDLDHIMAEYVGCVHELYMKLFVCCRFELYHVRLY